MRIKSYYIPVNPISWQRAGVNKTRFFDKQSQDKVAYGLIMKQQHGNEPRFLGPLSIDMRFYIKPPKKYHNAKWHCTTPDGDNFAKFLLDSIKDTDTIITDDRQFSEIKIVKIYDENPRTEFIIKELL